MKPSKFRRPAKKKTLWIALGAGITAIALAVGIFALLSGQQEPVSVYSFSYIGMTEFWGDNQESYGPVTTDKIQTVFLSDTQTVTELLVKEGNSVKKGDLLMTFDTTLSELQLERKRLEVEKEKLQLIQEEKKLDELRGMTPREEYDDDDGDTPALPVTDPGNPLPAGKNYVLSVDKTHDGKTEETPVICWLKENTIIAVELLEKIYDEYQQQLKELGLLEADDTPSNPSSIPEQLQRKGVLLTGTVTNLNAKEGPPASSESSEQESSSSQSSEQESSSSQSSEQESSSSQGSEQESSSSQGSEQESSSSQGSEPESSSSEASKPESTESTNPTEPTAPGKNFYIIFRTSEENMSNNEVLTWEGLHVTVVGNAFSFQFFPALYWQELDPFYVTEPEEPLPTWDVVITYTAKELQKMITDQRKTIKEQEFKVRLAENAYKIMEKEISDGNIYAEIDGVIVSLLDEEESKQNRQPFLKLSGGGGFLIKGSVSELSKDSLTIGQEVTVNDWNTGGSYMGTIQEIGDFPSSGNGWTGMGNPTATYYPFTVFVDESADLQSGIYASIQYASSTSSHGIYLENPFIRTEDAESYVLVRNGAGRLEKRPVVLGKVLWGSYTEILSGVTEEDWLAFPYGKEAKAGAPTKEGSLEELYGY